MEFNADLVDDIARRRVVLFIGSGVSASAKTRSGQRIRTWAAFLSDAAKLATKASLRKDIKRIIAERDYLLAAELLQAELGEQWQQILREEFAQVGDASDLHRAIVRLNQRILITTNFDKLLENAWNDDTVHATHHPRLVTKLDPTIFKALRDDAAYLIKLHGTIDESDSLIFTKSSYSQYAYGSWVYNELMHALLLNYTFIFLGFSMADPAVSLLIERHAQRFPDTRPHYIFLPSPVLPQITDISKKLRRLYVLPYSPANNHRQLIRQVDALGNQAKKRETEIRATSSSAMLLSPNGDPAKKSGLRRVTKNPRRRRP